MAVDDIVIKNGWVVDFTNDVDMSKSGRHNTILFVNNGLVLFGRSLFNLRVPDFQRNHRFELRERALYILE